MTTTTTPELRGEALPLEVFGSIIVYLHPHAVRRLQRLSRRYHVFIDTDDFQFARNNLLSCLPSHLVRDDGGGDADSLRITGGWKVERERRRRGSADGIELDSLDWRRLGASYRAALVSILNFTTTTLRLLNPSYHGLTDTAPPGYDNDFDILAHRALSTAITLSKIDYTADGCFALQWAATTEDSDLFQHILENTPSPRSRDRSFHLACRYGRLPMVKMLLNAGVHPATHDNYGIRAASSSGHTEVVRLLLETGKVRPNAQDDFAIIAAAGAGHMEVVRMLLLTGRVDPTANDNEALRSACMNGHADVVKLLLVQEVDEDWVEPLTARENLEPRRTTLIPRPGVDAGSYSNYCIKMACFYGHADVVDLLLSCEGVDPSTESNSPLCNAAENGHTRIVKLLLASPRVDPSANNNYALKAAASRGHVEIVKMLLDHPFVDPSSDQFEAIREATENQQSEVLKVLLETCFPAIEEGGAGSEDAAPPYLVKEVGGEEGCGVCVGWGRRRGTGRRDAVDEGREEDEDEEGGEERLMPNRSKRKWIPFRACWKRK
ncbi:hypothetical protein HDU67_001937 [Dinochytrium kinnereticum]|nr:hypothetical protein HDU67_001937 [Dinochytrium kinnereticum]